MFGGIKRDVLRGNRSKMGMSAAWVLVKLPGYRSAAILIALIATALISLWALNSKPGSPWEKVHRSDMTLAGESDRIAHWIDQHSPISLKLSNKHSHSNGSLFLTLGTNRLWWSLNNGARRTGWLMFWHPFSTNAVWEFAPCGKTNLIDVGRIDINTAFVGFADSRGAALFGAGWATNAIRVTQGEIVLARRAGQDQPVYVILFRRQAVDDFGKTEVEYLKVSTNGLPNKSLERTRAGHIGLPMGTCMDVPVGQSHYGLELRESDEEKARRLIAEEMAKLKFSRLDLSAMNKGDERKVKIAARLRRETSMPMRWIVGN
jgi:hypothetical protein